MVTATRAPAAGSIVVADRIAGIVRIFEADVNAVIHRRRMNSALASDATAMLDELAETRKLVVEAGEHVRASSLQRGLGITATLADDIGFWAGVVADLCDAPLVGVRLTRAVAATCPRFHSDYVMLRAAITYVGPGTELLAENAVDRSKLAPNHGGVDDESSGLIRDRSEVWRARAGDVVVMKGELWRSDVGGVVHRSPPHTTPRLLVTLDPLG